MFQSKKTRAAVLAACGVALATASGGVALAVADNVKAPYAQAAAAVSPDGKLLLAKGIDSVTTPDAGVYCVKLADPDLTVGKVVVTATSNAYRLFPSIAVTPHPQCGNDPNSLRLTMVNENGAFKPGGFSIAVH